MKVVVIAKTFTKGGAASGARNLRFALSSAGAEVISYDSASTSIHPIVKVQRMVERVVERTLFKSDIHCIRFFPETISLKNVYGRHRPDIIQLCDVSGNTVDLSEASQIPCPVVHRMSDFWPYHGPNHYELKPLGSCSLASWSFLKLIKQPDFNYIFRVAPSEWLGQMVKESSGCRPKFIPNAVQLAVNEARKSVCNPGFVTLGFISKSVLDPRKGFLRLLDVLDKLRFKELSIKLVVYGSISEKNRRYSNNFGVEYKGPFRSEDLTTVYGSFDILLCPSRLDNSPNVVTEALAHGCLVVGHKGTGMDSYIYPEFGCLFNFWDCDEDFDDLGRFIDNAHEQFSLLSENAISYVGNNLTPERIGYRYIDLYNNLIRGKKECEDA